MQTLQRFLVFATIFSLAGIMPAQASSYEDYKNATTAEELIRAETAAVWKNQGADPADQPRYFQCWVDVNLETFNEEERATVDRFVKDRSQENGAALVKAQLSRKGRVDLPKAIDKACDRYVGE